MLSGAAASPTRPVELPEYWPPSRYRTGGDTGHTRITGTPLHHTQFAADLWSSAQQTFVCSDTNLTVLRLPSQHPRRRDPRLSPLAKPSWVTRRTHPSPRRPGGIPVYVRSRRFIPPRGMVFLRSGSPRAAPQPSRHCARRHPLYNRATGPSKRSTVGTTPRLSTGRGRPAMLSIGS